MIEHDAHVIDSSIRVNNINFFFHMNGSKYLQTESANPLGAGRIDLRTFRTYLWWDNIRVARLTESTRNPHRAGSRPERVWNHGLVPSVRQGKPAEQQDEHECRNAPRAIQPDRVRFSPTACPSFVFFACFVVAVPSGHGRASRHSDTTRTRRCKQGQVVCENHSTHLAVTGRNPNRALSGTGPGWPARESDGIGGAIALRRARLIAAPGSQSPSPAPCRSTRHGRRNRAHQGHNPPQPTQKPARSARPLGNAYPRCGHPSSSPPTHPPDPGLHRAEAELETSARGHQTCAQTAVERTVRGWRSGPPTLVS